MKHFRRILIPFLIINVLLAGIHVAIFQIATRTLSESSSTTHSLLALFVIGFVTMPAGMFATMSPLKKKLMPLTVVGYVWMGLFMIAFFFSLVEFFLSFAWNHDSSYWTLIATVVIGIWALFNGLRAPKIKIRKLKGPEFLKDFSVAQISDVHLGMPFITKAWFEKIITRINEIRPTVLAITGDLIDTDFATASELVTPLKNLSSNIEKLYVTGNHEYIRGGDWEKRIQDFGFSVLHNSNKVLKLNGGSVLFAGVPDRMAKRPSDPNLALKSSEKSEYKILLAHEPSSVFDLKTETCDLLLSGHTHGGQIFPFAVFVRMAQPVVSGFKTIRGILVYAHQGTGFWGPPMRWFTRAEIAVFRFS